MRISLAALLLFTAPALADSIAPVDAARCAGMKSHHVLNDGAPVGCARLAAVSFAYLGFDGREHDDGEIIVLDAVAPRVLRIFQSLKAAAFPLRSAKPLDVFEGDDDASMAADNTSGFNVRPVAGTDRLSLHAYGTAIDINPAENPYLTFHGASIAVSPLAGTAFVNRREAWPGKKIRPGMAEAVVAIFAENGFPVWGGNWDDPIDYQHFDIGRSLTETLAGLAPDAARAAFEDSIAARSGGKIP
jgi:hypothetical protein